MDTKKVLWTRKTAVILVLAVVLIAGAHYLSNRYAVFFTTGIKCLPYDVWLVKKTEPVGRGDYVAFRAKAIRHIPDGVRMVKVAYGIAGDKILTARYPENLYETITADVDGMEVTRQVKGQVFMYPKDGSVERFKVFTHGVAGTELPFAIQDGVIENGRYFVATSFEFSYDSRYWGLVDQSMVIGRAYPLL